MRGIEWLTYKELADRFGISLASVKQRVKRRRDKGGLNTRTNNAGKIEIEIDTAGPWYIEALESVAGVVPTSKPPKTVTPSEAPRIETLEAENKALTVRAIQAEGRADKAEALLEAETARADQIIEAKDAHIASLEAKPRRSWWPF